MKKRTDLYFKASQQNAIPLLVAVVGTDRALRALGKMTPPESFHSNFPLQITDYGARVMTFGDYKESISQNSEDVLTSLTTQTMDTYILTCDNADKFFTQIIGQGEEFLGGQFFLYQGFIYPGFSFSDYVQLFSGQIVDYTLDRSIFEITVDSSISKGFPGDDPELSLDRIYGLSDDGTGTLAEESLTYTELETFFEAESWSHTYLYYKEATGVNDVLFNITDDTTGNTRLEVGIDTNDNIYVKLTEDASVVTPTYDTYTTDYTVSEGALTIQVDFDANSGALTIASGSNSQTFSTLEFTILSSFNIAYASYHITTDDGNNIYVTDLDNDYIEKFDALGVSLLTTATVLNPFGVCVDDTGNIYTVNGNNKEVNIFDSFGNLTLTFGQSGSGDGQFLSIIGIDITPGGQLYISDIGNDRIQVFDIAGNFLRKFGTVGSGVGNLNDPYDVNVDSDSRVIVGDSGNNRVQVFSDTGTPLLVFGENGSGDGQFSNINCIGSDLANRIYVGDDNGLQLFDRYGNFILKEPFANPVVGASVNIDNNIVMSYGSGSSFTITTLSLLSKKFDSSDLGGNNTVSVGNSVNGILQEATVPGLGNLIDSLTPVDGVYEEVVVEGEDITEYDVLTEFVLPMTDQYSNPGDNQQNVALPLPYGDMTENSDLGVWVCPCIDAVNFVYCVAGWPVLPMSYGNTVSVYVDGALQGSGYTFSDSTDYEGKGNIAILTFASDPGGVVTVKCKGRWVNNTFPINPVDVIEDLLDYVASSTGQVVWQPDTASFAQSRAFCTANGYEAAGVIISNASIGTLINSILKSFLGSFSFSAEGKLKLSFLPLEYSADVVEDIQENEAIQYNLKRSLENVVKTIIINYAVSMVEIDRRFRGGSKTSHFRTHEDTYPNSTPYTGKTWELNFDWNRDSYTVLLLANRILELYGVPNWILSYTGQDFKFIPVDIFDGIETTLSTILDETGQPVESKVFELREKTVNLDDFTTSLVLYERRNISLGSGVYIGSSPVYIGANPVYIGT